MKTQLTATPPANKRRFIIGVLLAIVLAGGVVSFLNTPADHARPLAKKSDVISITLPPPPPPPPKPEPPKPEPPKKEMVEQAPVDKVDVPEETAAAEPQDDGLSTNNAGNGPDMGLHAKGGTGPRNRIGGSRRPGKWDGFAVQVQNTIAETLRHNAGTRSASFSMQVRVWADANGRVTRSTLVGSSGSSAVDQAIKSQVFAGLQLPEAPPADMPMPITMRISARKGSF